MNKVDAENENSYECLSCKRIAVIETDENPPVCCGKPMRKIPAEICLQPQHAEHARPMEKDDACDDFRGVD
jgi:hypothetical protein